MVIALGPGRFYGSSLPRPWYHNNNDGGDRVDPPVSVLDPLLSWAEDAHWTMGGLSTKRHRLQGRIEGSIQKIRVQEESKEKKRKSERSNLEKKAKKAKKENVERMKKLRDMEEEEADDVESEDEEGDLVLKSDSEDDDDEEEKEDVAAPVAAASPAKTVTPQRPRMRARNLVGEFDRIAASEVSNPVVETSRTLLSKRKINRPNPKTAPRKTTRSSPATRLTPPRRQLQKDSPRRSPRLSQRCCSESI